MPSNDDVREFYRLAMDSTGISREAVHEIETKVTDYINDAADNAESVKLAAEVSVMQHTHTIAEGTGFALGIMAPSSRYGDDGVRAELADAFGRFSIGRPLIERTWMAFENALLDLR